MFKQIFFYKYFNLATIVNFLIASLFIYSSTFLLMASLNNKIVQESNMILVFIILFGILFLLSSIISLFIVKMNLETRRIEIINKRIIGVSQKNIFKNVLTEQIILLFPIAIIGFLLSIPLNQIIISNLKSQEILDSGFQIKLSAAIIIESLLFGLLFIIFVTLICLSGFKNVFISETKKSKLFTKSSVTKLVFGLIFLFLFFALVFFTRAKVIYLFGGIFFLMSIWFLSEFIIAGFTNLFILIFKKNFVIFSSLKNMRKISKIIGPLLLIMIVIMIFLNFSFNTLGVMASSTAYVAGDANIKYVRGLQFLAIYLNYTIICFGTLIIVNSLFVYLNSLKKENDMFRKLGQTGYQIFLRNFIQILFIFIIGFILIFFSTMFISVVWNDTKTLKNIDLWFYEFTIIFGLFVFVFVIYSLKVKRQFSI